MQNKVKLKKLLVKIFIISLIFILVTIAFTKIEYHFYTLNFNNKLVNIINVLKKNYPNISEDEIMDILNNTDNSNSLEKYNIDLNTDSIILENNNNFYKNVIINVLFIIIVILLITYLFLKFNHNKDKEIKEITKYIEQINKKNYKLDIDKYSEDELSILKSEIYKITIMLKEQAEISNKDKLDLKESLSNISHQLKTPLTSILIILDNLLDNPNMDKQSREDFIFDIKKEINNISFLVQNILKLSKLDTNTVMFNNELINLNKVLNEVVTKLLPLCDLKNIKINLNYSDNIVIIADFNWQVEAISNILKNSIEHSKDNSNIDIFIKENKLYTEVIIKDYGIGIEKEDLPHIFERFYKGKNTSNESTGIGLALAKSIIEKSNGKIYVNSIVNKETIFKIRYYK